jgi:hypothetical protein
MGVNSIKNTVFRTVESLRQKHRFNLLEQEYKQIAAHSSVAIDHYVEGEREYLAKWHTISKYVSTLDYRLFSQFIGQDINIVPEYVMRHIIEPVFHPKSFLPFYNDKNMYDKLLPQSYLAKSFFRNIHGMCYNERYDVIRQPNDIDLSALCCEVEKIIVKPTINTGNGDHILVFEKKGLSFNPVNHNVPFSLPTIAAIYSNSDFVIQECLEQSEFTAWFNPSSVNTFRVFTYKSVRDDIVHVLGIVFRIGANNALVDNCHAGGKYIGINHDGSFANDCVFDQYGNKYPEFNGIDFRNQRFVVPEFEKVMEFSKSVGEKICHNRTLDLDVMIDKEGNPKLIEFNVDMCSPWLYQFTTGPVFGVFTDEVIESVKKHNKN